MEIQNQEQEKENGWQNRYYNRNNSRVGKVFAGILVIAAGALLLSRELGANLPHWLFSWKMMLIAIGLFVGFKHSFRNFSWVVLILIGGAFMIEDFYPGTEISTFFWPTMLMFAGLMIIFKPRRRHHEKWRRWKNDYRANCDRNMGFNSSDDLLDAVAVFGSVKKNIISKDFKGGEVSCVFGGAQINLSQADITEKVTLEVNTVFGGAKIIVPQNWEIQTSELVTVMGGIEDKRPQQSSSTDPNKILVLRGSAVFGGIEILNY